MRNLFKTSSNQSVGILFTWCHYGLDLLEDFVKLNSTILSQIGINNDEEQEGRRKASIELVKWYLISLEEEPYKNVPMHH
jgi:hypothetical protein